MGTTANSVASITKGIDIDALNLNLNLNSNLNLNLNLKCNIGAILQPLKVKKEDGLTPTQ